VGEEVEEGVGEEVGWGVPVHGAQGGAILHMLRRAVRAQQCADSHL